MRMRVDADAAGGEALVAVTRFAGTRRLGHGETAAMEPGSMTDA
jgi:hypothetical protein